MKIQKHLNLKYLTSGSSDLFLPPYLNNCVKTEDKKKPSSKWTRKKIAKEAGFTFFSELLDSASNDYGETWIKYVSELWFQNFWLCMFSVSQRYIKKVQYINFLCLFLHVFFSHLFLTLHPATFLSSLANKSDKLYSCDLISQTLVPIYIFFCPKETHILWNYMFVQVCEDGEIVHVAAAMQAIMKKQILSEISNRKFRKSCNIWQNTCNSTCCFLWI